MTHRALAKRRRKSYISGRLTIQIGGQYGFDRARGSGRRLLLGRAGADPAPAGRHLHPRRLFRRRRAPTPPTATTAPMPRRSRSSSIPSKISFRKLLEFFFQIHDPDDQEPPGQRRRHELPLGDLLHLRRAEARRRGHDRRRRCVRLWPGKVVTEVTPAGPFWEAEPEHQDYLTSIPAATPATGCAPTGCCPSAPSEAVAAE